jgi:hypothetical protein
MSHSNDSEIAENELLGTGRMPLGSNSAMRPDRVHTPMVADQSTPPEELRNRCVSCGAWCDGYARDCWHCGTELASVAGEATLENLDHPSTNRGGRFSLMSILLALSLLAVSLAVYRYVPCAGLILAVLLTPAVVRTVMAADERRLGGGRLTLDRWLQTLVWSFLVAYLVAACGVLTFMIAAVTVLPAFNAALGRPAATQWIIMGIAVLAGGAAFWIARPSRR